MLNNNSVFFITGASSGFGLEITKKCLDEGYRVVGVCRHPENILIHNINLLKLKLDISKDEDIDYVIQAAITKFGEINVLINNAGFCALGFFEEISSDLVSLQMKTNFFGTLNITRKVLPYLRLNKDSWIVTLSSVSGVKANAGSSIYCASKFALEGWMEALQQEVAEWGIKCLLIEPGAFRTATFDFSQSCKFSDITIDEYSQKREKLLDHYNFLHGKQDGDPKKLAKYLLKALQHPNPPFRLYIGKRAWNGINEYYKRRYNEFLEWSDWSKDSDFD